MSTSQFGLVLDREDLFNMAVTMKLLGMKNRQEYIRASIRRLNEAHWKDLKNRYGSDFDKKLADAEKWAREKGY